jgi:hypothetical protein
MPWLHLLAYFGGGLFLANCLPHLVMGITGRPFQSPFAKPPGEGLSSATVNVIWGMANLVLAYLLICQVGAFDLRDARDASALFLGMTFISLFAARHFGRFHGGGRVDLR